MKKLLFLVLSLLFSAAVFAQQIDKFCYEDIDAEKVLELQKSKSAIIVDVRTKSEYKKERIEGAVLGDSKKDLERLLKKVGNDQSIVVYCTKGVRSKNAAKYLCGLNTNKKIYNYTNGISDWRKKEYPLKKKK